MNGNRGTGNTLGSPCFGDRNQMPELQYAVVNSLREVDMSRNSILADLHENGGMSGLWWFPEAPDKKIRGRLVLTQDGEMDLTLERESQIIEAFKSLFETPSLGVVWGILSDGTQCSLITLTFAGKTLAFQAWVTEIYSVQYAIFGALVKGLAQFEIKQISLSLPVLMDWSHVACYSATQKYMPEEQSIKFSIETQKAQTIALGTAGNLAVDIHISAGWHGGTAFSEAPGIAPFSMLNISFAEQISLASAIQLVPLALNFFSLATLSIVQPASVSCESDSAKRTIEGHKAPYYEQIVVWYRGLAEQTRWKGILDNSMFFTYSDIAQAGDQNILATLLARHDEFDNILASLVPGSSSFHYYSQQRFLNATHAFECLDRMTGHDLRSPKNEFESAKGGILKKLTDSEQSWLQDLLGDYANEPSLRDRIKNILQQNAELLDTSINKQSRFICDAINTRNYIVHGDKELKAKAALDTRLVGMTDKLEFLARLTFLRVLGLTDTDLRVLLSHPDRDYFMNMRDLFHPAT